jgi:hypothetical protein
LQKKPEGKTLFYLLPKNSPIDVSVFRRYDRESRANDIRLTGKVAPVFILRPDVVIAEKINDENKHKSGTNIYPLLPGRLPGNH